MMNTRLPISIEDTDNELLKVLKAKLEKEENKRISVSEIMRRALRAYAQSINA